MRREENSLYFVRRHVEGNRMEIAPVTGMAFAPSRTRVAQILGDDAVTRCVGHTPLISVLLLIMLNRAGAHCGGLLHPLRSPSPRRQSVAAGHPIETHSAGLGVPFSIPRLSIFLQSGDPNHTLTPILHMVNTGPSSHSIACPTRPCPAHSSHPAHAGREGPSPARA